MFNIIYSKFLRWLDKSPSYIIFISIAKLFCWIVISISLLNIPESKENLAIVIKWHNFAILKVLTSFLLVFHIWTILYFSKKLFKSIITWIEDELSGNKGELKMYKNIPLIELVDYLFTSSWYSRSEFCEKFAVSRKVFDDMANSFDSIGVFIRGANNSRILNTDYSRSDISSILIRASETWEIRKLIRKTESWFTHSPSNWFITKRLNTCN